ncbi:tetratricopeptide repeat protein [Chitinophaga sp. Cy-1792]|uniref:tetratricopeptide repeat protein n=1 Tax=Chitinophaga sp. Cy-1792 TaxID=2608339 RepID=UPI00141DEAB8|nr:tetratricopeptide repeat protein [Chitinophaga sp. Cy-1792]NIG55683.1 tetratricopeptide repeat protein [Chitinophaga sp. Cy-1792]
MPVKKFLSTILIMALSLAAFAQDTVQVSLHFLIDNKKYDRILQEYAPASRDYSAQSLYYIGLAYFRTDDDSSCIVFLDRAIQKDSTIAEAWYVKGTTLNYDGKYEEALTCFQTAIRLSPNDVNSYTGTGNSYYALNQPDLALAAYQKAATMEDCPDVVYILIGQAYASKKENDKALAAYKVALEKFPRQSASYLDALYNIGLIESLKGNDDEAERNFLEILDINPDDYSTYPRLIQIYYHQKNYAKAKPYRDKLYLAKENNLLQGRLADKFCFEQFDWNGYHVQVYERYQTESASQIFYKHIFYLIDEKEQVVMTVQTEYSPFSAAMGGSKYLLCASKGNAHINPGIGFNDNMKYADVKSAALKLMERLTKEGQN